MIQKTIKFDDVTNQNIEKHNSNWLQISDYSSRILIIGGSESWKANSIFNLISQPPDIDKKNVYTKDPYKAKYQFLHNKQESTGLNQINDSKAFIEYANDIDDVNKNFEEHNPNKKLKILIVFDEMIADMLNSKKLNPVATVLFMRDKKLNISPFFYRTILLCCTKKYLNSRIILLWKFQTERISTNLI